MDEVKPISRCNGLAGLYNVRHCSRRRILLFVLSFQPACLTLIYRTTRLRFRVALHTLPLANPMRLAGEIAAADIICNGRLETGLGRGRLICQRFQR